jgi:hypothetical protein
MQRELHQFHFISWGEGLPPGKSRCSAEEKHRDSIGSQAAVAVEDEAWMKSRAQNYMAMLSRILETLRFGVTRIPVAAVAWVIFGVSFVFKFFFGPIAFQMQ